MSEQKIPAGIYKGRGIAGSEQYGKTSNGNDQIVVDLALPDIGTQVSTFLIFTDASAPYSIERLRALGWEGDDLSNLAGIDRNEVDVEIKYEMWDGKERMRVQILTGGGRVVLEAPMGDKDKRAFAARFKSLAATSRGGSAPKPMQNTGTDFPYGANAPSGGAAAGGQPQRQGVKL